MSVKIKVCGVTRVEDALLAAGEGVDFIGINFWPHSPRHLSLLRAGAISNALTSRGFDTALVGVFVNQSALEMHSIDDRVGLDFVQMHGEEPPQTVAQFVPNVIRGRSLSSESEIPGALDTPAEHLLVDAVTSTYGGSGRLADWDLAAKLISATDKEVFLAGGLTSENVASAIATVRPYGVDTASGVQATPGVLDPARLKAFVRAVRGAA